MALLRRDPCAGRPEQPYSQHPYQYAYSAPTTWTDPSGRDPWWIEHRQLPDHYRPGAYEAIARKGRDCAYAQILNPPDVAAPYCAIDPLAPVVVDMTPVIGDAKGLIEVLTGCDILTGEDIGVWRWAGLFGLSELRYLRAFAPDRGSEGANLLRRILARSRSLPFRFSSFSSLDDFEPGPTTAFHGLYLPWSGEIFLEASEGAVVKATGATLSQADGYIRNGGHGALRRKLEKNGVVSITEEHYMQVVAFTLHYRAEREFGVSWLSRGVNGFNFPAYNNFAPDAMQQPIIDAIQRIFGGHVISEIS